MEAKNVYSVSSSIEIRYERGPGFSKATRFPSDCFGNCYEGFFLSNAGMLTMIVFGSSSWDPCLSIPTEYNVLPAENYKMISAPESLH